eukprot:CAMPEP_0175683134 /NCGR_PEP_ID=MMETSP0097-20121207/26172_1 /TAXON_ID=311494 /ORGANISM="Alexandrium monilatum, Strain CCMP3105" /LENGTH=272 /DNA_ID=CAMNT_0016990037 /DNA_START=15 /DNA_END=831 /DNA_ORIENTATION=-
MSCIGGRNFTSFVSYILSSYDDTLFYFDERTHPGVQGCVALTIDDGFCRNGTECSLVSEVRELLQQHGARATFFLCSTYLPGLETEAQKLLEDGNEFANHMTMDSHKWAGGPIEEFEADLRSCSNTLEALQHQACPHEQRRLAWFRAPGGRLTSPMREVMRSQGLRHALGDCYCDDWCIEDADYVAQTLLCQARSGSVIIMHMPERGFREHCLEALRQLLEGLAAKGLTCVTLSDLAARAEADPQSDPFQTGWDGGAGAAPAVPLGRGARAC